MFSSISRVIVSSGSSTSTLYSSTSLASSDLLATSTTSFSDCLYSRDLMMYGCVFFFRWLVQFIFRYHLLQGWSCMDSCLSFFLLSVYFQYLLIRLSCYEGGLCMSWTIYISLFTELVRTISNAQFSVNYLLKSVILVVLCLLFTEVVCNWFAELDSLSLIERFFRSICWTWLTAFIDHFWSQLEPTNFLCLLLDNFERKKYSFI